MIPVYNQILTEEDAQAVCDVVRSQYISQLGKETKELEQRFAALCQRKHAITCSNGTTALHLALKVLGCEPKVFNAGSIIIPSCTFAAVGFAPAYLDANIEIVDVDPLTWNIDVNEVELRCRQHKVDAVIAVHNYGNPADMNALLALQAKFGFRLIEDACEALTATLNGKPAGSFGDASVFSFYGNKLITGGEGGMLLVNDSAVDESARYYRGQAQSPKRRFWHEHIGYNYRITNMQSALILSQMNRLSEVSAKARSLAKLYQDNLAGKVEFQTSQPGSEHSWWMVSVLGSEGFGERAAAFLKANGVETRPVFPPLSEMPAFNHYDCPVARRLNLDGITLPGGPGLTEAQALSICDLVKQIT